MTRLQSGNVHSAPAPLRESRARPVSQAAAKPARAPGSRLHLVEQNRSLQRRNRMLEEQNRDLRLTVHRLRRLALIDGLTGLANRRYFDFALNSEIRRACRDGAPLTLVLADVDNFKGINDRCGHGTGDLVLSLIGGLLSQHCRRGSDTGARYGGEEFAMLLGGTPAARGIELAERLRRNVENLAGPSDGMPITLSLGVTTFHSCSICSPDSLIEAADAALYGAKEAGRNRTRYWPLT